MDTNRAFECNASKVWLEAAGLSHLWEDVELEDSLIVRTRLRRRKFQARLWRVYLSTKKNRLKRQKSSHLEISAQTLYIFTGA